MSSGFAQLVFFVFLSSLSVNLILQCGLGMAGICKLTARYGSSGAAHYGSSGAVRYGNSGAAQKLPFLKILLGFITVIVLWLFFTYIVSPLSLGFFGYILFFPVVALVYYALEYLLFTILLKSTPECEDSVFLNDGILGAALFFTYNVSGNFLEALAMVFGFSVGSLLTLLIVTEIVRRSEMEAVPKFLAGRPLILISMGLLSLVFTSSALILFRILGN